MVAIAIATSNLLLGINRNILECKLSLRSTVSRPRQRINRNILECKFLRSDRL